MTGVAGAVGIATEDGRVIDPGALRARRPGEQFAWPVASDWAAVEVPLLGLALPGPDHTGSVVVGALRRVRIVAGGLVEVEGETDEVEPGEYPCGMDLADVQLELRDAAGDPAGQEYVDSATGGDVNLVHAFTSARLLGVTLYLPGSTARAAFEAARLVVSS